MGNSSKEGERTLFGILLQKLDAKSKQITPLISSVWDHTLKALKMCDRRLVFIDGGK